MRLKISFNLMETADLLRISCVEKQALKENPLGITWLDCLLIYMTKFNLKMCNYYYLY